MSQLEDLLQQCTVKLTLPDLRGWGTGFFVALGWIRLRVEAGSSKVSTSKFEF